MLLTNAQVTMFRSIEDSGDVPIDPYVTVLVGQNESGKTAYLQALHKARPAEAGTDATYALMEDYPRRAVNAYEKVHATNPAVVAVLTYQLQKHERDQINAALGFPVLEENFSFSIQHRYDNKSTITLSVPESGYIKHILSKATLTPSISEHFASAATMRALLSAAEGLELNAEETTFIDELKGRFDSSTWSNMLAYHVWSTHIRPIMSKFLYFDDYYLLPGKVNLPELKNRVDSNLTREEDKTVLGLLRMADVDLDTLINTTSYENVRAKLEGISISITDQIFEYWTQNRELDVEFDIRSDRADQPPFNSGANLYIRIRNRRHRMTVPFSQRSKGFIWFFSFIVWFDSVRQQLGTENDLILLLDEPGLSLHALAQADFLRYIDHLAENHQILYTTHSPFMVHSDRLHQVRTVEDRPNEGTKISDNVSGSDPNTLFPLQAALGYTIAQNLFISKRNLLVEGPADLIFLKFFSAMLEEQGRTRLRDDITIVPVGGLGNVATFVALLSGNLLEFAIVHDYANKPDARLESLVREKMIRDRQILNYAMFRSPGRASAKAATTSPTLSNSDVEDMLSPALYLRLFNAAYAKQLGGAVVKESDLPPGDRIVERIERHLVSNGVELRPSGGYNHYLVASHLASNPVAASRVDAATLERFEQLFERVNGLFTTD